VWNDQTKHRIRKYGIYIIYMPRISDNGLSVPEETGKESNLHKPMK